MTSFSRSALTDFDFGSPVYAGASVAVYTVDGAGNATATLASLYAALSGEDLLANPQTLDGNGQWQQPVYIDTAVILKVTGANGVPDHQTGVVSANLAGDAASEAAASAAQASSFFGAVSDLLSRVQTIYAKFKLLGFPIALAAGKYLRANAGGTAYEFRSAAETRGDLGLGDIAVESMGDGIEDDGAGHARVKLDATSVASALSRSASGIKVDPSFLRGYLAGLTTSNNVGTPNTKLDIAAGIAADDGAAVLMKSAAALTIDCATVGANGLDAGALANTTWYFVYLIAKADGTVAGIASTSATAPAMPAGYAYKRRVGAFKTDGTAHILAFAQNGDEFIWATAIFEGSGMSIGTVAVLATLNGVPPIVCDVLLRARAHNATAAINALITSTFETDQAPSATVASLTTGGSAFVATAEFRKRVNTDQKLRLRTDTAGSQMDMSSYGFIDARGRFA